MILCRGGGRGRGQYCEPWKHLEHISLANNNNYPANILIIIINTAIGSDQPTATLIIITESQQEDQGSGYSFYFMLLTISEFHSSIALLSSGGQEAVSVVIVTILIVELLSIYLLTIQWMDSQASASSSGYWHDFFIVPSTVWRPQPYQMLFQTWVWLLFKLLMYTQNTRINHSFHSDTDISRETTGRK